MPIISPSSPCNVPHGSRRCFDYVLSVPGSRLCSVIARLNSIRKILVRSCNRFKSHDRSLRPVFAYVCMCWPELGGLGLKQVAA